MNSPARESSDESLAFAVRLADLNLNRIAWFLATCLGLELTVFVLQFAVPLLRHPAIAPILGADLASTVVALSATLWIRHRPPPLRWRQAFVFLILCALLGVMDYYFFGLLTPLGITSLYVVGVMCAGMLFLIPPVPFFAITAGHHVVFCAFVLHSALSSAGQIKAILEGSVGLALSLLTAWLFYTARRADFQHERSLAASNHALQQRNLELNELMAIAAHDLRSPLQGVQHVVEIAAHQTTLPPEKRQRVLEEVLRTCGHMLTLIGRLLEAHRAETDPDGRRARTADFMPVVAEAVRRAQLLGERRRVGCELRTPAWANAVAHHEPGSLQQALDNLIANAVNFSPEGGTVAVDVRTAADQWLIEVHDEGPGVAESERPRLFQKFFRGSVRPPAGASSSGLGLFITRSEVEAMGGSIHYLPRAPRGSTFVIKLQSGAALPADHSA